jgi:hypothetical protein
MFGIMTDLANLATTRQSLHAVAELILAGPQYRRSGTIRLRVLPGGFGTISEPDLRVAGDHLVAGDQRLALRDTSYRSLGAAAGVQPGAPVGLYQEGCEIELDETVRLDAGMAGYLAGCFALGDAALRELAPRVSPVLWPEHFDLGVALDDVNYGISPGDGFLAEPYAYIGPWQVPDGEFWNAPFGAARPLAEFAGLAELVAFLTEGRDRAG